MKVRVKQGQKGFIYGSLRKEGQEFDTVPVESKTEKDGKGNPVMISAEDQFSGTWMEEVNPKKDDGPVAIKDMKAPALKEACKEAGIEYEGMEKATEALEALENPSNSG